MSLKILIADDEEMLTGILVRLLKANGFPDVFAVSRPEVAIEYIEKNRPDLVFLDINFKREISGLDILKRVTVTSPESRICMLSAYREEHEQLCLDMKATAFLKKPTTVDDLLGVIRRFDQ